MDKIQSQLIKPFVEKMEKEWQALYDQVRQSPIPEAQELCPLVEGHLGKLRQLSDDPVEAVSGSLDPRASAHDFIRQSKMDLRSAERRFQRCLVSTERVKTRLANHSAKFPPTSPPQNSSV